MSSEKSPEEIAREIEEMFGVVMVKDSAAYFIDTTKPPLDARKELITQIAKAIEAERAAKVVELPSFTTEEIINTLIEKPVFSLGHYDGCKCQCDVSNDWFIAGFRRALELVRKRMGEASQRGMDRCKQKIFQMK